MSRWRLSPRLSRWQMLVMEERMRIGPRRSTRSTRSTRSGMLAATLLAVARSSSEAPPPPAFRFVDTRHTAPPPIAERRGYHFVLADEAPNSSVVYGCGINGELAAFRAAVDSLTLLNSTVSPTLLQSRAMVWHDGRLIVSNRDLLFYEPDPAGGGGGLDLVANVSIDSSAFWADTKQGINGLITAEDVHGTTLLVGAAMQGVLVAATLPPRGSAAAPQAFGHRDTNGSDWGLAGAYDLDTLRAPDLPPQKGTPPLVVVVSPHSSNTLGVISMHDSGTNAFLPPASWRQLGAVPFREVKAAAESSSGFDPEQNVSGGCNRVRVHQQSRRAAFSCFGSKVEGGDLVGFVDLKEPSKPRVISAVPFVSKEPTGMLIVNDALIVAGEHDMMVFDMRASTPTPPLVATCGSACARIGGSNGQNFHSVAYKELAGGRHMVFVSAQIDNNVGAVEIVSPEIIALLKPPSSHY